jgi:IclR family transcriptional regulator, pca regulon regulatory protein
MPAKKSTSVRTRAVKSTEKASISPVRSYQVEAILRGLEILALFRADRPTLTLVEISRLISGVPSTTLRIVNTLEDMGFLESLPNKASYRAGLSSLRLGHSFIVGSRLRSLASPSLTRLLDASGESVTLSVLDNQSIYVIDHLHTGEPLSLPLPIGARLPAHNTAAGKAMLAFGTKAAIKAAHNDGALDAASSLEEVMAELAAVKRDGYAIQGENISGTRSISAPVIGLDGQAIAAVSILVGAGHYQLADLRRVLSPLVVGTAAEVGARWRADQSADIGDRPTAEEDNLEEAEAPAEAEQRSRYHVEALSRGLLTLLAFSPTSPRLTLTEIAQRTSLLIPASFRVMSTLSSLGYVRRDQATGTYELTVKVLELGYESLAWLNFSEFLLPSLLRFESETQVLVYLSVLARDVAVDIVSLGRPGVMNTLGRTYPLYCTPGGKVLLAFMEEAHAQKIIDSVELVKRAPRTLVDRDTLLMDLELIRTRGYSVSEEEYLPGSRGVGVPIFNGAGECVASVGCVVRGSDGAKREALEQLVRHARALSEDLSNRLALRFG